MSTNHLWQTLCEGDQIQIVRMPSEFSAPNYQLLKETLHLYKSLITNSTILTVHRIDEDGFPWIEHQENNGPTPKYHSLMINHNGLQRVSN